MKIIIRHPMENFGFLLNGIQKKIDYIFKKTLKNDEMFISVHFERILFWPRKWTTLVRSLGFNCDQNNRIAIIECSTVYLLSSIFMLVVFGDASDQSSCNWFSRRNTTPCTFLLKFVWTLKTNQQSNRINGFHQKDVDKLKHFKPEEQMPDYKTVENNHDFMF